MTLARYERKHTELLNQMAGIERFTPEWNELEKKRMRIWVRITDIRQQMKEAEQMAKAEKIRYQNSIMKQMDNLERYSPEWWTLQKKLMATI